ncbi:DUF1642 domain-containing protein [Streptococcus thermophilus]|uniref:DUF1642 domain-containing protein n=1 Tax=Streptococcus thermophilus TaxID=1308 RepID=UPI00218221D7|nr:DUF1642 domain-containing protein [Streptococcus thermophilus]MCS9993922.1 DUF1642 domain-containing protein [Streptococcus thermophilus]
MTREEAVMKLVTAGRLSVAHAEDFYDSIIPKPVVPQYVADWYEEHKDEFYLNLHRVVRDSFERLNDYYFNENPIDYDFARWYYNTKNAIQILGNMHQLGYEVEREPRYTVRIRNLDDDEETYLNYDNFRETWVFYSQDNTDRFRTHHTHKELEEGGFDWVFYCEGIEIKEVE